MTVKVKFCGGCNPRYDREALLGRLAETFPEISFRSEPVEVPDAGLVICGCDAACADASGCIGSRGRIVIWKESAFDPVYAFLQEILKNQKKESES